MRQSFVIVFAATVARLAAAADDCRPEKEDAKSWQCCKVEGGVAPQQFEEAMKKCMDKNPKPPRTGGAGPPSEAQIKEMHQVMDCSAECVFGESGLLSADKSAVDKAAATKAFKEVAAGNKEMEAAVTAALDKCFASYAADVDQSAKCKSGARQLEKCLMREGFLNCPRSMWNSSDECAKLKAKIAKCPNVPVMLVPPPPHPH